MDVGQSKSTRFAHPDFLLYSTVIADTNQKNISKHLLYNFIWVHKHSFLSLMAEPRVGPFHNTSNTPNKNFLKQKGLRINIH